MTSKVGEFNTQSFGIQTEREFQYAKNALSAVLAGDLSKCSKEGALRSRLLSLQQIHSGYQPASGARVYDFSAGENIKKMEKVLDSLHNQCLKS